jgi:phage shock protein A
MAHRKKTLTIKEYHMSFFGKLVQQIKGGANDALDAVSDNGRAVRQSVREMEEDIEKATAAVADVNAQKSLIANRISDAKAAAADWGQRAERALKLGDEALATSALQEQVTEEGRAKKYEAQLAELTPQADRLNQLLATRKEQLENAKIDSDVVQANNAVADATMAAAKSLSGAGSVGTFKASKDAVAVKAAKANAMLDLNEDPAAATERKLREMETNGNVSDRLAALKAKVSA